MNMWMCKCAKLRMCEYANVLNFYSADVLMCEYTIWSFLNVGIVRVYSYGNVQNCKCSNNWLRELVNVRMCECASVQMKEEIWECAKVRICKFMNVQYANLQMYKSANVKMWACDNMRLVEFANMRIREFENVRCASV